MNILVIDAGTSSMRGTIYNEKASSLKYLQRPYSPVFSQDRVTQKPSDWLGALVEICQVASALPVDAVAITSQRSSLIPADEDGNPLTDAIMWQDTRNRELCDSLSEYEETVSNIAGTGINTVYSGGKMAWFRKNEPDLYEKTEHLFVIPDYLIFHMTGRHVTDHTYGSRSMLMDLRAGKWSEELLEIFGINKAKLGTLIPPSSVAGHLSGSFSSKTGLREGIPVISCGGDQQCGAVGQGSYHPGDISVTFGTGAYTLLNLERLPDKLIQGLVYNAASQPGRYILETAILTCGAALNWFMKEFCKNQDLSYVSQALQNSTPGANGVTVLPFFQGSAYPDWNSNTKAFFYGISLSSTKEDILRALIEGICIEIATSIPQSDVADSAVRLSGGMSLNPEICQIFSNITGRKVLCSDDGNATSRGAWMSAACCLGITPDLDAAWALAQPQDVHTYHPSKELIPLYKQIAKKTEDLYRSVYRAKEADL